MAKRLTRRRVIGAAIALVVVGAIGGSVALRLAKKTQRRRRRQKAPVALEFAPADLAQVGCAAAVALAAGVRARCSRCARRPSRPRCRATCARSPVREGETVQAGQVLARIDTADLEAKLIERIGALESAKAQLAMAEKTRTIEPARC